MKANFRSLAIYFRFGCSYEFLVEDSLKDDPVTKPGLSLGKKQKGKKKEKSEQNRLTFLEQFLPLASHNSDSNLGPITALFGTAFA